jgi:hypothetical protein
MDPVSGGPDPGQESEGGLDSVHPRLNEHGDLAGGISIPSRKCHAASNREVAELFQVNAQR